MSSQPNRHTARLPVASYTWTSGPRTRIDWFLTALTLCFPWAISLSMIALGYLVRSFTYPSVLLVACGLALLFLSIFLTLRVFRRFESRVSVYAATRTITFTNCWIHRRLYSVLAKQITLPFDEILWIERSSVGRQLPGFEGLLIATTHGFIVLFSLEENLRGLHSVLQGVTRNRRRPRSDHLLWAGILLTLFALAAGVVVIGLRLRWFQYMP